LTGKILRRQEAGGIPINKFRGFNKDTEFKSAARLEIHLYLFFINLGALTRISHKLEIRGAEGQRGKNKAH
jgi:hypothetical protein